MTFNNRAADRQADTHAALLGRVERIEERLGALRLESHARVFDAQPHMIPTFSFGLYDQLSWPIFHAAHCIRSVQEQIQNHLLKLYAVTRDLRKILCEIRMQSDLSS